MSVPVSVLLQRKGTLVHTIIPDASLAEVTHGLLEHNVGALVVSRDGVTVEGVISERDIVRALARSADMALSLRAADAMSSPVMTCSLATRTREIMEVMTEQRVRHLPVVDNGRLVGIISIGDVVKWRIDELAEDAERLQEYVTGRY